MRNITLILVKTVQAIKSNYGLDPGVEGVGGGLWEGQTALSSPISQGVKHV